MHESHVQPPLSDDTLLKAVHEMEQGLVDADLGGSVYKKRVPLPGKGKRGSVRTLLAFRMSDRAFCMFGFAKNRQANISPREERAIRLLANEFLGYTEHALKKALDAGELVEVPNE
ncbi:type II toxin-antitoxin system RelE/ParE family toxin [Sansalvadorimonas verongulae]|nr:type II toxin-antitoxin system RelE/ParE family toxin [Sansalvadorimonas verongulae]